MKTDILASLTRLSDAELVAQVKSLVARDRDTNAQLVARLAELDTRDVHLREGYASLFVYCRDALGLSEWEAYNRIEVARTARRFPVILDMLREGSVNLTAVRLLAPHLTPVNHREVLESARGKRKPEVEEIVARLSPRPDVRPSIRRVPTPAPRPLALPAPTPTLPLPTEGVPVSPLPGRPAWRSWPGRSSPTRPGPDGPPGPNPVRVIPPPRSSARCGCGTSGANLFWNKFVCVSRTQPHERPIRRHGFG